MLKHYVELDYPGAFFPETSVQEIESREYFNPPFGKGLYAFTFFDREEVTQNGEVLRGPVKNKSERTVIGEFFPRADFNERFPEEKYETLRRNLEYNSCYVGLVLCPAGNWQPLQEGETVIENHE